MTSHEKQWTATLLQTLATNSCQWLQVICLMNANKVKARIIDIYCTFTNAWETANSPHVVILSTCTCRLVEQVLGSAATSYVTPGTTALLSIKRKPHWKFLPRPKETTDFSQNRTRRHTFQTEQVPRKIGLTISIEYLVIWLFKVRFISRHDYVAKSGGDGSILLLKSVPLCVDFSVVSGLWRAGNRICASHGAMGCLSVRRQAYLVSFSL